MLILGEVSVDDRKRLLELFPVADLRQSFQSKGTKEEICYAAAGDGSPTNIQRITEFVDRGLSSCKQHVYVFYGAEDVAFPDQIGGAQKVLDVKTHALYVARVSYTIMLRDPLEETTLEFLWPIRVDLQPPCLLIRFVVLEKNISSYFDKQAYVASKSVDEKGFLGEPFLVSLEPCDLNKGIKKLWADGYIESTRSNFKKTFSTSSESMDEDRGIKEHYPELYSIMQEAPLYTTLFQVNDEGSTVKGFSTDPSRGIIGFTSYSGVGDTDEIIQKIIANN